MKLITSFIVDVFGDDKVMIDPTDYGIKYEIKAIKRELVFCKDCKYRDAKMIPRNIHCKVYSDDYDFCSYGRVKDGE